MPARLWITIVALLFCCQSEHVLAAEQPSSLKFTAKSAYSRTFKSLAVSPDGSRIALCAGNQIHLIDTVSKRVMKQTPGDPFTLRYSADGTRLYGIGTGRNYLFDQNLNELRADSGVRTPGYVGISVNTIERRLILSTVSPGGPVAALSKVHVGDELVAVGEGRRGRADRVSSVRKALERLKGPVGTWVQLEIIHAGTTAPKTYQVQRWSANRHGQSLSFNGPPSITIKTQLLNCTRNNRHDFDVIPTGKTLTSITPIDIGMPGPTALSRDSKRFAVLSRMSDGNGKAVEVFDIASGERLAFIAYQGSGLTEIAFSSDGDEVYAASVDSIEVMDIARAQTVARLHIDQRAKPQVVQHHISTGPSRYRNAAQLAVASTGEVATGSTTGDIRFWDIKAGKQLLKIANSPESPVLDIKFSDGGSMAMWFTGDTLYWMPLAKIRELHKKEQATEVTGFARISATDTPLPSKSESSDSEYTLPDGVKLVRTFMTHPVYDERNGRYHETFLEFSPDGKTLYLGGSVGVIPKLPQPIEEERRSRAARTPGNIVGATADAMADGAQQDRATGRAPGRPLLETLRLDNSRYPIGGKFRSIKGLHGKMPGSVDAYRVADGQWLRTFECREDDEDIDLDACVAADLSPDGKLLVVLGGTGGDEGEIHMFNAKTGKLLYEFENSIDGTWYNLQEVAILGDSQRFLTRDDDNYIILHAAKNGRILDKISIDDFRYHKGLHVSADGKRIVLGKAVLDAHTAEIIQAGNRDSWRAHAVSFDGKRIVGGTSSYRSQPHMLENGFLREFGPLREGLLRDVELSPDGKYLCLAEGTVAEIWAVDEQLLLASLDQHLRMIDRVAFAPDGKLLATCSQDGATRIWDLSKLVNRRIPAHVEPTASDRFQANEPVVFVDRNDRKGVIRSKADDGRWFVRLDERWQILANEEQIAVDAETITEEKAELDRKLGISKRNYGPEQILGRPDTKRSGDYSTAWCPKSADNPIEWLFVEFRDAVVTDEVVIHETYHPGAIQSVTLYTVDGKKTEVWKGTPGPHDEKRRELKVKFERPVKTKFAAIELSCELAPSWNEIDAVGLIEKSSKKIAWAHRVLASSTYASGEMNPKFLATLPEGVKLEPLSH